ncbi:hypothetical protein MAR_036546 [Mya arenaria]|uniref:Uncharacterized protein n=1 Tax=Mya arenaria TaxID=6604 RepID=A0ABY7FMS1_MYAAR|nr:hypothetical protein MAR_036546 [Mya arenaria]
MSVCSATAAAYSRPGRRESRNSSTRASTSEQHFYIDKGGLKPVDHRKYSTNSTTRHSSSSNLCCVISVLLACILVGGCELLQDFIG